jgi:dTDP-3-amino-3,4,6-trideoxy-alpha-D-glucose transaminase
VIAVHLFGNVAPVAEIEALGVPVLEDAAQAAGSRSDTGRPGALGTAATFSFFPSKNLGCFGDGGIITTSDEAVAECARTLRFHGSHDKITYEQVGYNSRLDELQAAILRVQLPHLDTSADGRRAAGGYYAQAGLGELATLPRAVDGASPAWHLYVVRHPEVERLESALKDAEVGHKAYYRTPVHRQVAMREWGAGVELPATEQAARTHLAIPLSPVLSRAQVDEVVTAARHAG